MVPSTINIVHCQKVTPPRFYTGDAIRMNRSPERYADTLISAKNKEISHPSSIPGVRSTLISYYTRKASHKKCHLFKHFSNFPLINTYTHFTTERPNYAMAGCDCIFLVREWNPQRCLNQLFHGTQFLPLKYWYHMIENTRNFNSAIL